MIDDDLPINKVTPQMIQYFKTEVMEMYEPVKKAIRKVVFKCTSNPEATCIQDPDDDDNTDTGPLPELTIQQEEETHTDPTELMQSLEKPLTDRQAEMIGNLFYNQTCMLEY